MTTKLCRDCVHAERNWFGRIKRDPKCRRTRPVMFTDRVTGEPVLRDRHRCAFERMSLTWSGPYGCGPEARFFVPRNPPSGREPPHNRSYDTSHADCRTQSGERNNG